MREPSVACAAWQSHTILTIATDTYNSLAPDDGRRRQRAPLESLWKDIETYRVRPGVLSRVCVGMQMLVGGKITSTLIWSAFDPNLPLMRPQIGVKSVANWGQIGGRCEYLQTLLGSLSASIACILRPKYVSVTSLTTCTTKKRHFHPPPSSFRADSLGSLTPPLGRQLGTMVQVPTVRTGAGCAFS